MCQLETRFVQGLSANFRVGTRLASRKNEVYAVYGVAPGFPRDLVIEEAETKAIRGTQTANAGYCDLSHVPPCAKSVGTDLFEQVVTRVLDMKAHKALLSRAYNHLYHKPSYFICWMACT